MLVLTRVKEEAIMIGHQVEVKVLDIRGDRVRLGIVAPPDVPVHRKEVYLAIQKENVEAARPPEALDDAVRLYRGRGRGGEDEAKGKK